MELGEKLRQARLEAGLSQRQLCGDTITRNMLSQIESGKASPSMNTLRFLAAQLGKSVGYFLEEQETLSPNVECLAAARRFYAEKDYRRSLAALDGYISPDEPFDAEYAYLQALNALALGIAELENGDPAAAEALLESVERGSIYYREEMERQRRAALSQCYALLEERFRRQGDFQNAYFYACKRRK